MISEHARKCCVMLYRRMMRRYERFGMNFSNRQRASIKTRHLQNEFQGFSIQAQQLLMAQYWVGSFIVSSDDNRFAIKSKFNPIWKKSACYIMQADFMRHVDKINPLRTNHFRKGNSIIYQLMTMMFPFPS